ncbi:DUF4124 domain-containing protein [Legionella fallonii]|uniref:DUF4124 domain-containing protein n=1 Tax=Legionella fallonii LLAP-10 TaxID=1212491 RepID=A0A098G406_9GAMM|nr:DUF4124 domain-containing protein [Legionella fallonii]CEG56714.1 conserved exported protein of unknown function [Legionella fallonii LLAP-10]
MDKFLWGIFFLVVSCASSAQVYTWTDSQGVVHFSDTPHQGAEKIDIPDSQTYSPPTPTPKQEIAPATHDNIDDNGHSYTKVAIREPSNQATIRNPQGYTVVSVEVEPQLADGDKLQLIYDGSPLGDPQPNTVFELNGMYRGSHTIAIQVVNANGKVLITSDTITIYMQQPRVGMGHNAGH